MTDFLVMDGATVRSLLDLDELLEALREAFVSLSLGNASVPPRNAAFSNAGLLGAMPGYLPGAGLAVKLVTVFDGNEHVGLPSHQAVILLFDESTGSLRAMMDGTYITAIRTAASAAVAAIALAREDSRILAVLGSGAQAEAHLEVFNHSFDLKEIRIAARNSRRARALAEQYPAAEVVDSFKEAVMGADIVACCTNADQPVIRADWLSRGAHVSSVGRFDELDQETIERGSVFVEWKGAATHPPPAGASELQHRGPDSITEIGLVLGGESNGRASAGEITVYKSTGHAVEDAAAAGLVYRRAVNENRGTRVPI